MKNIQVEEGPCGTARTTALTIKLQPRPDAPVVRDFQIRSTRGDEGGRWPEWTAYRIFLDAPASVSQAVRWSSGRPEVATIDQLGVLRTQCWKTRQVTTITATLKADTKQQASAEYSTGSPLLDCRKAVSKR
ncbi:hypothetical protein [Deinococcus hopiensis]|nr:hypothetical protein [Deinococcus hopiensis]